MTKEQYNLLAPYQREMYDKRNRVNKSALLESRQSFSLSFLSMDSTRYIYPYVTRLRKT